MFGKKQPPLDKNEIDHKFRGTIRTIQRSIDNYEEKIQTEFDNAVNYRKAGNIDEEARCMRKINRLMAAKIRKRNSSITSKPFMSGSTICSIRPRFRVLCPRPMLASITSSIPAK